MNPQQADLTYSCTCTNGSSPPNIAQYLDTLPNNICQETFKQCNIANPGSSQCVTCGKLAVADVQPSSTSMSASASASATSAAASGSASADSKNNAAARGVPLGFAGSEILMLGSWIVGALAVGAGALVL